MPKFKLTWWERNNWEATVEAENEEEAKKHFDTWSDKLIQTMQESDDSFVDRGDVIIELEGKE